jgi:hypothetical protein
MKKRQWLAGLTKSLPRGRLRLAKVHGPTMLLCCELGSQIQWSRWVGVTEVMLQTAAPWPEKLKTHRIFANGDSGHHRPRGKHKGAEQMTESSNRGLGKAARAQRRARAR